MILIESLVLSLKMVFLLVNLLSLKALKSLEYTRKDEEDDNVKNDSVLYFTERYFSGVKKMKINQFIQDIDKALDSMKIF